MPQDPKSFFFQSPHGTNSLQSIRMSTKSETRIPKPPKPPEKPLMPYMRYSRKVWEQVKNSNPHLKLWEVGRIIGQMWRELPDDEKTLYVEEYEAEKTHYTELLRQYHSSPAYQAWLVAKERVEKTLEEQEERKQANMRSRDRCVDSAQADLRESYILEDNEEDTEEQFTAKHVAAARFQRNHRLMQEILSDARLPDPGQLITQSRLNTLRLQVEQLKNHKRNLCQEIEGCELRHQTKVQRIREDSDRFRSEYMKITSNRPVISESQFADMIVKAKHDMQREEEDRRVRYLAEMELRRRRQQREIELMETDRRRQLLHQQQSPARMPQPTHRATEPNPPYCDRPIERPALQPDKRDDIVPSTEKSIPLVNTSASEPVHAVINVPAPDSANHSNNASYPSGSPSTFNHLVNQTPSQKFVQSGHTQHHYPPPPNYPPNALSPSGQLSIPHLRPPSLPPLGAPKPNQPLNGPTLKVNSSASSTSSASSISSTSSKRRKSDTTEPLKEKLLSDSVNTQDILEHRTNESHNDPSKPTEFPVVSVSGPEVQQTIPMPHRQHVVTQQYPPNSISAGLSAPNSQLTGPSHPAYGYGHGLSNSPMVTTGYYHPNAMHQLGPHPPNFGPHARPQFGQHPGYSMVPGPLSVSHQGPSPDHQPPPPPVYIQQHIPSAQQAQQSGHTMQHSSHPLSHTHQNAVWNPIGQSNYSPHYEPSRYASPGGPVSYPQSRHYGPNVNSYNIPHYPITPQNVPPSHPHHTPVAPMQENNAPQIPAPPPYQQQQQTNSMGYWMPPHQLPPDYGTHPQSTAPPHYISGPQPDPNVLPGQPTSSPIESVHLSSIGPSHTDVNLSHMGSQQSQSANVYYSGGPYGHPGNISGTGFYSMSPQHHYPPVPQHPHGTPHGTWPGYPPSNMGSHISSYHQQSQPTHQQQCVTMGSFPISQAQSKPLPVGSHPISLESSSVGHTDGETNSRPSSVTN